jgi:uncharacterized caspase-like protein
MASLATSQGIASNVLITADATRAKALDGIRKAAKQLKSGDLFLLSYSGHGGQVDDVSGEEDDKLDETWCLYDGQLIDDELYLELSRFGKGVRIVVLSDSCHSGTVTRAPAPPPIPGQRPKIDATEIAQKVYADHKAFYDGLQRNVMKASKSAARLSRRRAGPRGGQRAADEHCGAVQCRGAPDFRLPGQSDLDGRRAQRRVH